MRDRRRKKVCGVPGERGTGGEMSRGKDEKTKLNIIWLKTKKSNNRKKTWRRTKERRISREGRPGKNARNRGRKKSVWYTGLKRKKNGKRRKNRRRVRKGRLI